MASEMGVTIYIFFNSKNGLFWNKTLLTIIEALEIEKSVQKT